MKSSSFQVMYFRDECENLFKDCFLSSSPRNWGATLDYVNPIITEKQKFLFTSPFSEDEISVKTHQLGYLKALGPDGFSAYCAIPLETLLLPQLILYPSASKKVSPR